MKKYKVMLNGRNFQIASDGVIHRYGFFTTRCVEANNPRDAELLAVDIVKNDALLRTTVKNKPENPPMIHLDELIEVTDFEDALVPGKGYSFYPED